MMTVSLSLFGFGLVGAIAPAGRIFVTVIPRTIVRSALGRPNPALPAPAWSFAVPFVLTHGGDQAWSCHLTSRLLASLLLSLGWCAVAGWRVCGAALILPFSSFLRFRLILFVTNETRKTQTVTKSQHMMC